MLRTTTLFVILLVIGAAMVGCSGETKVDAKAAKNDGISAADRADKQGK